MWLIRSCICLQSTGLESGPQGPHQRPQTRGRVRGTDPGDARSVPDCVMIDAQLKGCQLNVASSRLQATTYTGGDRSGKRQCQVQIGGRQPFDPLAQQRPAGRLQRRAHLIIRPQCKEQPLPGLSRARGHGSDASMHVRLIADAQLHDHLQSISYLTE